MYIGIDFLIDSDLNLYISEINTGLPGGAQEYDYIYRIKHKKRSSVFNKINYISKKVYSKNFFNHINELPYIDDLRKLKVWMDGMGPLPKKPSKALRLEDKWVQYLHLKDSYPMIGTEIFNYKNYKKYINHFPVPEGLALKRRVGRGGRGFRHIKNLEELKNLTGCHDKLKNRFYIIQPYIKSKVDKYHFSIRAAGFAGYFICCYANLALRETSNHGFLFHVVPGDFIGITSKNFKTTKFVKKAWEANIFFGKNIPSYLYHNLYEDEVASADLIVPSNIFNKIKKISESISAHYKNLKFENLPRSYIT